MVMFHPDASQWKELLGSASISCGVARRMAFWSCGDGKLMGIWWENVGYSHGSKGSLSYVHESSWWKFIPIYILVINLFKLIYYTWNHLLSRKNGSNWWDIHQLLIHPSYSVMGRSLQSYHQSLRWWLEYPKWLALHFFPKCMDICLI